MTTAVLVVFSEGLVAFAAAFVAFRYGGLNKFQAVIIGWLAGLILGVAVYGWP